MGYEEGFSSDDDGVERKPLLDRFRKRQQPVQRKEVVRPEGADEFLRELRVQSGLVKDIVFELRTLNENLLYVGAAVDGLQTALAEKKKVKE